MKTPKGTDLPLTIIKGKEYLEVKYRLVWFLEEKPDWTVETEIVSLTETSATMRALIKTPNGMVHRVAHKTEDKAGFFDFMEKAETGAIGRALGLMGYGTLNAQELEEGDRIVDSPVPPKKPLVQAPKSPPKPPIRNETPRFDNSHKQAMCMECDADLIKGPYGYYCPHLKMPGKHSKSIQPEWLDAHIEEYEKEFKKREKKLEKKLGLNYEVG